MLATPQVRFFLRNAGKRSITSSLNFTSDVVTSQFPKPLERPFRGRGGQNLSERFKWLENSLRGKDMKQEFLLAAKGSRTHPLTARTHTFHGFHVPQEPIPPADDECCMSGCAVCVYDLYEESLAAYKDEVDALHKALIGLKIPESQWPPHIRLHKHNVVLSTEIQRKEKILCAFEEMERALAQKKHQQIEKDKS